ncbi:MAG TPA: hypothetical protein VJ385_13725 [Fibrobacteria bacterium]|nr:hypothetical protein [Fibrobacteria bacterium]
MLFKWLPWKYMVRRVARRHGFLDPLLIMSRLANFAQPSEVGEPIELLRAGLVFHARGLMNTRAIQNNLDWIWPYWVERQFNPRDSSFIPRAFSISHINLSHRNWTAVGIPDSPFLPIVDPSGLVTPYYDGWSLDAWILHPDGANLLPSKSKSVAQSWELESDGIAVETTLGEGGMSLHSRVEAFPVGSAGECRISLRAQSDRPGWLAVSLRPYNPEGVSFVNDLRLDAHRTHWIIDGFPAVGFSEPAARHYSSEYLLGDVFHKLSDLDQAQDTGSHCKVGMATGAALFPLEAGAAKELIVKIDLSGDRETPKQFPVRHPMRPWAAVLEGPARLEVPDAHFGFLYDAALRTLLLHSPGEVFPGPYTYKRFWFRDAAFILNAMLAAGMVERAERTLDVFPSRQTLGGYFLSQEGEWDSNGEALWILRRYCEMSGRRPKPEWIASITKAVDWIARKRIKQHKEPRVVGLFPAGFSAEHLGPNDYYYWDDFWGAAGLQAAAWLLEGSGHDKVAQVAREQAADFMAAIEKSLEAAHRRQKLDGALPASPLRRMDSGAIGSIVASYPLSLWPGDDTRIKATLEFLLAKCMYRGAFFQDMIHSGMNAYLTLHMAQCLLRADDPRYFQLIRDTAAVASPTGQWPEAIHPHTLGGCMGDGQHVWAAAEWVLMMRNLFVREEDRVLVIASGIPEEWLRSGKPIRFGPGPTHFGPITVSIRPAAEEVQVEWEARWHTPPACIVVRLPGRKTITVTDVGSGSVLVPDVPERRPQPAGFIHT